MRHIILNKTNLKPNFRIILIANGIMLNKMNTHHLIGFLLLTMELYIMYLILIVDKIYAI